MPRGLCQREAPAWLLNITAYGANRKHTMSQDNTSAVFGFTSGANINDDIITDIIIHIIIDTIVAIIVDIVIVIDTGTVIGIVIR